MKSKNLILKKMWEACQLNDVYKSTGIAGEHCTLLSKTNDFGYIKIEKDMIIVSFKGSDDIIDWFNNFKFFKVNDISGESGILIHEGFFESWLKFKHDITHYFEKVLSFGEKRIYVTGHSRGGAIAVLCARHLAKNLNIPCDCITFGAPRIGNKAFRDQFSRLPIYCTQVINGKDPVPLLPLKMMGYKHAGKILWLKSKLWFLTFPSVKAHLHYEQVV